MADDDHTKTLNEARDQLVARRRDLAKTLAGGYKAGDTEKAMESFVKLQETINCIIDAIEDEESQLGEDEDDLDEEDE